MVFCPPEWTQVERGTLSISAKSTRLGCVRVFRDRFSIGSQLQGPLEFGTLLLGTLANDATHARWFGMRMTEDDVAVGRAAIDICATGPGELLSVLLDANTVRDLGIGAATENAYLLRNPSGTRRLRSFLSTLFEVDEPFACPLSERLDMEKTLLALVRDATLGRRIVPGALTQRFQAVRTCDAYMHAHIDEPISLQNLSDECGFRPRSLINAFEAFTGVSPMMYLKSLRLNGVRKTLRAAGRRRARIIDIAMDWGFEHMGHFAADYRAMFGERPSETPQAPEVASPEPALAVR
jgi:AraC-like DNA-binding protein